MYGQQKRRKESYRLLGKLPLRTLKIAVKKIAEEDRPKYILGVVCMGIVSFCVIRFIGIK